ncbi:TPA: hypothetical protein ACN359_002095 [Vibrio parahaemolyticus]
MKVENSKGEVFEVSEQYYEANKDRLKPVTAKTKVAPKAKTKVVE